MSKKTVIWIGLGAAVVAAGAVGVVKMRGGGPDAVEVQTGPVERMTIVQTVTATGRIQPETQVNISADVSAKITRLAVEEGDWVEKGAFLVELDRGRYLAAVESAEASLRVGEANAEVARENMVKAEKDYLRIRQLFEDNLETQATLDAAEATYQAEKARRQSALDQVEQTRAALKQARDDLSKTTIYAPMAGTVSELNKEVGEIALGSQFQEDVILVLSNLSGMEALVDVDENDIVSVSLADEATVEVDALPDRTFRGEVSEIASSAKISGSGTTDQKTEFEVKVAIVEPGTELRPGMTASADIVTDTREQALGVPIQCVAVRTPEQLGQGDNPEGEETRFTPDRDGFVQVVFVADDGTARARQVKTGIQSDSHIEILQGLEEGEQVVVGSFRAISRDLRDGSAITEGEGEAEAARLAER